MAYTDQVTMPAWVPSDEHKPAPMPLLVVQSFVNTRDLDQGTDLLTEADAANRWLHQAGLLGPEVTAGTEDLRTAREVREGVRALLARARPAAAGSDLRPLEELARTTRLRLTIDPAGQIRLDPGSPGRLANGLLSLLLIIRDAQLDGSWHRLKTCGNPGCQWAFYDRSHSRRGTWCDMASCGNLIKNRNLRARRGRQAAANHQPG
jgi:predicted RNA-binding Zn ribbon-like protein